MESNGAPPGETLDRQFVLDAFDQHQRRLTAYAVRLCGGDSHRARDAVQHTFMQLCQQPADAVSQKLAQWLYTVCRNRVLDEKRLKGRATGQTESDFDRIDDRAVDPAESVERNEFSQRLRQLFGILSEPEREVLELWSHGFDTTEIAAVTEQRPGTVRVNLHRAIKRLQRHPEVSMWLERATGHVVAEGQPTSVTRDVVKGNGTSKPAVTGEKR